eukprot:CAMPEP_0118662274 /NCGR_PEP_ID=MMETSP0785-20121206/16738_1 /TAXON_ID=91992 /ORGANISM="Bolidomonas pacifica, Strain CCMP 1866" /LENGTH=139 /DNA_ID=CAMNT_0006555795 /DNA_START=90 /DNA_END=509 /DNA_ORIENTATION=+
MSLKRHPLLTACAAASLKGFTVDLFVQYNINERKTLQEIDKRRLAFFSSFGLVYVGATQFYLFTKLFPAIASSITASRTALKLFPAFASSKVKARTGQTIIMTGLDSFVHIPFVYLPIYYSVREIFYKYKLDDEAPTPL